MIGTIIEYSASLVESVICIWFITEFINARKNKVIAAVATIIYFGITSICDNFLSNYNILGTSILYIASLICKCFCTLISRILDMKDCRCFCPPWQLLSNRTAD